MQVYETEVLFRPETPELRFLPEGPCQLDDGRISFVGIQHGADSRIGSINVLLPVGGTCTSFELPGRPGFAFPTDRAGVFVAGVERELGLYHTGDRSWQPFAGNIDNGVQNTIINDGLVVDDNLVFGCKELTFSEKKAGLYLWRRRDQALIQLRDDQICSNGKGIVRDDTGTMYLIDIDSPSRQITRSVLDLDEGTVGEPTVVVDLTSDNIFPDGMIITPDHASLIVAMYDPADPDAGEARQYCLTSGELQAVWKCPGSPRVTCPQLISHLGRVRLLLTTAVEHMDPEQQARHPNAGCLFVGDTPFRSVGDQTVFSAALS
jgi:sugar lactone lactonase YvrE